MGLLHLSSPTITPLSTLLISPTSPSDSMKLENISRNLSFKGMGSNKGSFQKEVWRPNSIFLRIPSINQ